jgi:hypothetical protein
MTIYMENVLAFSLRVIPKCFACGKREKGIRHFSLITPRNWKTFGYFDYIKH